MCRSLSVVLLLLAGTVLAQQPCDPDLRVAANNPLGYMLRGDRCEGLYIQQVAGGSIRLASLHFTPRVFRPEIGKVVRLSWTLPPKTEPRIQAVSLKAGTAYRMDSIRPSDTTSYDWPAELLPAVGLRDLDVGLVGWGSLKVGSRTTRVYSPISIEGGSGALEMVLLPDAALQEVFLSLVKIDEQGRDNGYAISERPLKFGYYPARQPIKISLPPLRESRYYRVEVGAPFKSGGQASLEAYVYSAGKP